MTKLKNETRETFSYTPIISVLPLASSNGSKVSLSISPHFKCKRLACCVSLASSRILPFCSSAPVLAAAVAAAGSAKLALFPTVILSALMQSPFGTAGCHGTRSILPTGTQLEHREWSVWQETSGHEKVQCDDFKREAKYSTQRMVEVTRFSLLKWLFCHKKRWVHWQNPRGSFKNERNAVKLCRTGKWFVVIACRDIWIINVNMFCFLFPGK